MRAGEAVFVDSGAWIALALTQDPLHQRSVEAWELITEQTALIYTSIPVIIETFTFLDRHTRREVAIAWKESIHQLGNLSILQCGAVELLEAWRYFERRDLHKLSAVDATSFVLMTKHGITKAFAFDHHFASVGFRLVG